MKKMQIKWKTRMISILFMFMFIFINFIGIETVNAAYKPFEMKNLVANGDGCENIVFVIVGDGFTKNEQSLFETKAKQLVDYILSTEPYSDMKESISFYCIDVISEESGAGANPNEPKNTYFQSCYYYRNGIERLLGPKKINEVYDLVANYIDHTDAILLLVNDTKYGGGAIGEIATASINTRSNEIMLHEMGHTIGYLADEYWAGDYYARESVNMTRENDPAKVPWSDLVGINDIGIYPYPESPNWYHPSLKCRMRHSGKNYKYCAVCKRALIEQLEKLKTHITYYKTEKQATCTESGIKSKYCVNCGAKTEVTEIPKQGHKWSDWKIRKVATALSNGIKIRNCFTCGSTERQDIKKLDATAIINVSNIQLKVKQSTTKVKVTGLAKGDYIKSWRSSNTKIVTVNSKGKITANNKTGKATITVTMASGLKRQIGVTVQKSDVLPIQITGISNNLILRMGETETLNPVVSPSTDTAKVTYTSSNKKVATINSKGKITAKSKGETSIIVKCGKKKVICKVTVY